MTLTQHYETVATSETHETNYFCGTKSTKIQAVAQDFRRAPTPDAEFCRESVSFRDTEATDIQAGSLGTKMAQWVDD